MTNLLSETLERLSEHDLSPADVRWVGSNDGRLACPWEEFARLADRRYDNGFGGNEVAMDIVVVGDDWWLEREEYDGSEWWVFKRLPARSGDGKLVAVFGYDLRDAAERLE